MQHECDIIAVTWNQKEIIKSFIDSFLESTSLRCRLIIVDNASADGTREYLLSLKDTKNCEFKVMLNEDNKGFVRGINQGIAISTAPYVCWANDDLIFCPGWLEEILSILMKNPAIGVVSPNSNNLGVHVPVGISMHAFAARLREEYKGVFVEMSFCVGFCLVVRREVIDKVGGFSEEFAPLFFEDTDYSMKAQKAGYRIGFAKAAYVWHKEHASVQRIAKSKEEIFSRNRELFHRKWGKILRIAWIEDNYQDLLNDITEAIKLARGGNFITFIGKNFLVKKEDVFRSKNIFEHSGVLFRNYRSSFGLLWYIAVKKKKFNLIITKNKILGFVLDKIGQNVTTSCDETLISNIKL